jgi:glycosyltransferase involved in cell wall biosynthesis
VKLCIPIPDAPQGGMYSFFRNFRRWLGARGVPHTEVLEDDWDVLVVNSWVVPYGAVWRGKRGHPGARVLHRVDGSAADYGRDPASDRRQRRVNTLADVTVFQSRYGREATLLRHRVIGQDGPVIPNPVDTERFTPDGPRESLLGRTRVAHVAWSTNPKKGSAHVADLARRHPDVTFVLIGRYENLPALPNIVVAGHADWERLPRLLRGCECFLILAENEACPNVVLEALASGLPVLYRDSGGTGELVGDCGVAVVPATFGERLAWVLERREALSRAARARAERVFGFDVVFPRYLEAATTAARRPLPSRIERLGGLLRDAGRRLRTSHR